MEKKEKKEKKEKPRVGSLPRQKNKNKEEKDAKILFDNDGKGVKRQCKNDAEKVSLLDEVSEKVQFNP